MVLLGNQDSTKKLLVNYQKAPISNKLMPVGSKGYDMGVTCDTDMPRKRVNLSLPEGVYADLEAWAENQGRPVANLAAYLVETGIKEAKERGEVPIRKEAPLQKQKGRKESA